MSHLAHLYIVRLFVKNVNNETHYETEFVEEKEVV